MHATDTEGRSRQFSRVLREPSERVEEGLQLTAPHLTAIVEDFTEARDHWRTAGSRMNAVRREADADWSAVQQAASRLAEATVRVLRLATLLGIATREADELLVVAVADLTDMSDSRVTWFTVASAAIMLALGEFKAERIAVPRILPALVRSQASFRLRRTWQDQSSVARPKLPPMNGCPGKGEGNNHDRTGRPLHHAPSKTCNQCHERCNPDPCGYPFGSHPTGFALSRSSFSSMSCSCCSAVLTGIGLFSLNIAFS